MHITPGEAISLYFEVYGLHADNGPARFNVAYEVARRRDGGILRRARETITDGRLITNTVGTRASEYLYLATNDWASADEVEVTVHVLDRRTGGTVSRSIVFEVSR